MAKRCFIGVDVGTGSVRAGVFDVNGNLLGSSVKNISIRQPEPGHFEQSSEEIWCACCTSIRQAVIESSMNSEDISAIAFDATCSLVCHSDVALAVGGDVSDVPKDEKGPGYAYDIIMWCDHRATDEAMRINRSKHRLLDFVGGQVFPEMELPKLAWLKKYQSKTYVAATHFYDLADYLMHRATDFCGTGIRSQCTVVCKWNFDAQKHDWDESFFEAAGLSDLPLTKIGTRNDVKGVGNVVASLGTKAAKDLGLSKSTIVGVGAIDAHAGGLGCLGAAPSNSWPPLEACMALIAGTSACHMTSSSKAFRVPGVWGPFDSAMVPGLFLHEAGQSAAGAALDYVMETHAAFPALQKEAISLGRKPADVLSEHIQMLAKHRNLPHAAFLTRGVFVGPDFNGNRSPLADPSLRGSIIGLGPTGDNMRATSIETLGVLYLATVQALSYSTRAIVETINSVRVDEGITSIKAVHVCGGLAQNNLYLQEHCNVLGLPFCCTDNPGADVIRGSAMLAATAAGEFSSVYDAMRGMSKTGKLMEPSTDLTLKAYHDARYNIFLRMQKQQQEYYAMESRVFEDAKRQRR